MRHAAGMRTRRKIFDDSRDRKIDLISLLKTVRFKKPAGLDEVMR